MAPDSGERQPEVIANDALDEIDRQLANIRAVLDKVFRPPTEEADRRGR